MSDFARKILLGVVIVMALLAGIGLYVSAAPVPKDIRYSSFLAEVHQGQVSTVTLQGDMIYGVRKDKSQFKTYNPESRSSSLLRLLMTAHVAVEGKPEDPSDIEVGPMLLVLLVSVGLLCLLLRLHRMLWGPDTPSSRSRSAGGGSPPVAGIPPGKTLARGTGRLAAITYEGDRPQLIEFQVQVDPVPTGAPYRDVHGVDPGRVARLIAVLSHHSHLGLRGHDVTVRTTGGLESRDPGADLPLLLALASSRRACPLPAHLLAFGEIDLNGAIRPVPQAEARLRLAQKQGFELAIVPQGNAPQWTLPGLAVIPVASVDEALAAAFAKRPRGMAA